MGLITKIIIIDIILLVLILFVAGPLISSWDYNHDNYLYKKYPSLFAAGYDTTNNKIIDSNMSSINLRHELIHKEQWERGQTNVYLNEFEAYVKQYFFWRKVNLTTLDWE